MDTIEHCRLATNDGKPFRIVFNDAELESLKRSGWVVVEYVPRSELTGAVETLAAVESVLAGADLSDDAPSTRARVMEALRVIRVHGQR